MNLCLVNCGLSVSQMIRCRQRLTVGTVRGLVVLFFCFVETANSTVPHMEAIPVDTLEEARTCARRLLDDQRHSIAAHIFDGDLKLETLTPYYAGRQAGL